MHHYFWCVQDEYIVALRSRGEPVNRYVALEWVLRESPEEFGLMPADPKEHANWWNKICRWHHRFCDVYEWDRRMITSKGQKLGEDWEERWRRTCENVMGLRRKHARPGDPNGLLPIEHVWDMDECCTWFETTGSHTLHKRTDKVATPATTIQQSLVQCRMVLV